MVSGKSSGGWSPERHPPGRRQFRFLHAAAAVLLAPAGLGAQDPSSEKPKFDPAAVERGKDLHVNQCGFCHGSNARGGAQGPDLTRAALVQGDEGGKDLGAFLAVGRPERGMPRFDLPPSAVVDLATFYHATIDLIGDRSKYQILDILVGDAKKGEAFFHGEGGCAACHSTTGDLKGVGSRYEDPATLQGRVVMPRGRRRGPPGAGPPEPPPHLQPTAVTATVALPSGLTVTGPLVRLTDFDVTVYDPTAERMRSWVRHDGVPAVVLKDPLQAHMDMLRRWRDSDLHDVTAFLASLK